ncbi:MAG: lipopolysaccharide-modifying protein [Rhodobacteraceae bacterium]|nr:MAG: lipopolysaccharide-modifying protein [Paracoccaceae bacterium]
MLRAMKKTEWYEAYRQRRRAARDLRKRDVTEQRVAEHVRGYFERAGVSLPELAFSASEEVESELEFHLVREGDKIRYLYHPEYFLRHASQNQHISSAYIYWFSQSAPEVERISCDLSDGEFVGHARFTYSSCFRDKVLVPDQHFFRDRGYAETDRLALEAPQWADRGETIYWRGQNNCVGLFSLAPEHMDKPWVMQRLRFAMAAREIEGVDARFVPGVTHRQEAQCAAAGLMGPRRNWQDWAGDKYALDVDGFSNAWCNFMQRLKLGCCVLKVDSQFGFRQWYYDQIVPFEHFVPVKSDLSDLAEKVDWVRSHDREAREIAEHGQAFARALTFESETRRATEIIERNWA